MAAEQKLDLDALVAVLKDAPDHVKSQLRQALGASGTITRKGTPQNNQDAKRIAFQVGESLQPDGFVPKPSEALEQSMGKEAAHKVTTGAVTTFTARDADQMVQSDNVPTPQASNMQLDPEAIADMAVE
mgnify:CR=1 FL=1